MYSRWTEHLKTEEEKQEFIQSILSARLVLERLNTIIDEDVAALDRSEISQKIYDLPNWDYRQAHKNGNRQSYAALKLLTNLDQQKGTTYESTRPN